MNTTVETVTSADGTRIALERTGRGAPVILVGGAFNDRSTVAALAATLAPDFTAITYDRRGRGDSGNNDRGFDVNREFDDLAAVIERASDGQARGMVSVFGHSSGGVLAIEAALRGLPIKRLAVYEPSYVPASARSQPGANLYERLVQMIGQDRRDDAVTLFQTEAVGLPAAVIEGMRASDFWGWFTGLAHTLPYDVALHGGYEPPAGRLAGLGIPVLAVDGSQSPQWIRTGTRAVAEAVPGGRYVTLEGQDHGVLHHPEALHPVLSAFLAGR
ncbi:MAG TPA: alpha/beta hydrolase [Streptosporangiaceae bacterium]|nr:alpha/beta hydrolase [Streptosporangiaceae bacterium]